MSGIKVRTRRAYAPFRLSPEQVAINLRGIAAARAALAAARRDEFPGITERQRVDQALAATDRGQR